MKGAGEREYLARNASDDPLHDPRGRKDRCRPCDRRYHGQCRGGVCTCPVPRCADTRGSRA